jgi:protein O-GlcNAc transferase
VGVIVADITQMFTAAVAKHQANDLDGAEKLYRSILQKLPSHPPTLCNLGAVLARQERFDDAAKCYSMCLAASPGYPDAHYNLGNLFRRVGRHREAISEYQHCLKGNPNHPSCYFNMGLALVALNDLTTASEAFRQTITLEPNHADAYNRLGDVLLRTGKIGDGIEQFRRYISLRPDDPRGYNNLGLAIANVGRPQEAVELLNKALALNPNYPDAHNTLALAFEALHRKDEANHHYREAVRLRPDFADAWSNLGTNLTEQGRADEAIDSLRKSLEIRPFAPPIHSNLLLTLNYTSNLTPPVVLAEHRKFADLFAANTPPSPMPLDPDPNRRLRIGYLSGDFRDHTVAGFIRIVLKNHRREQFHVTAYSTVSRPDAVTAEMQGLADRWSSIVGGTDDQAAAAIRNDKIDILIDLSGHTAGNRLLTLAQRPAPIQAILFGYPNTTGLNAVDYRITDTIADPVGQTEPLYVEKLLRLNCLAWCYAPPSDAPLTTALPALSSDTFTFGCLNNAAKISDACRRTWAKLLQEIPNSKLVVLVGQSKVGAERLTESFTSLGVKPEQLVLKYRLPKPEYFATYSSFDLALDPFPYNGGVTTCDALWMGVPVLTLVGDSYVSRQGVSILTHAGMPEFAADTPEALINIAKTWAENREVLAEIRAGLREQFSRSLVCDATAYVRSLEAAYRHAWRERVRG